MGSGCSGGLGVMELRLASSVRTGYARRPRHAASLAPAVRGRCGASPDSRSALAFVEGRPPPRRASRLRDHRGAVKSRASPGRRRRAARRTPIRRALGLRREGRAGRPRHYRLLARWRRRRPARTEPATPLRSPRRAPARLAPAAHCAAAQVFARHRRVAVDRCGARRRTVTAGDLVARTRPRPPRPRPPPTPSAVSARREPRATCLRVIAGASTTRARRGPCDEPCRRTTRAVKRDAGESRCGRRCRPCRGTRWRKAGAGADDTSGSAAPASRRS